MANRPHKLKLHAKTGTHTRRPAQPKNRMAAEEPAEPRVRSEVPETTQVEIKDDMKDKG
jgi:hypothetical protein